MPAARNMKPSWLIVEYASTRLMSSWPSAASPANSSGGEPDHERRR